MPVYFAFLRGINVGGNKMVPMAELRKMLTGMGFDNVKTLLQSGNAMFETAAQKPEALEAKLEAQTKKTFGFDVVYMVRTEKQLKDVIKANPFPEMTASDPSHLLVVFLKGKAKAGSGAALQKAIVGNEVVKVKATEAYVCYPDGIGVSKLTNTVIDRHLGVAGTARNWNTVQKTIALVD